MVNKGLGEKQESDYKKANKKILEALNDFQQHRYNELQTKTKLSTATLTKHLKDLDGLVERILDQDSKEYPPPVYYRLKLPFRPPLDTVGALSSNIRDAGSIIEFIENMEFLIWSPVLTNIYLSADLKDQRGYQLFLEYYILPIIVKAIDKLKNRLADLKTQGVDVDSMLLSAQSALTRKADDLQAYTLKCEVLKKE